MLTAGAQVVRQALVEDGGGSSRLAQRVWPSHPEAALDAVMAEVGRAAAHGRSPGAPTLALVKRLSETEPLAAEPFLVHGAISLRGRDQRRAEALLVHARDRQPRSSAARYLLADLYLRTAEARPAVTEMAALARLLPGATRQLAPALAQFARSPGAAGLLRPVLSDHPEIKPQVLYELAGDSRNVDLILALAGADASGTADPDWQRRLLSVLIDQGEYARAHAVWRRLEGMNARPAGIFNPSFQPSDAPPPFNWELARGSGAVAEGREGALHVLYFGREDVAVASQMLVLPAGSYVLSMRVAGQLPTGRSIRWILTCAGSGRQLVEVPLNQDSGSGPLGSRFSVPSEGCAAQKLELKAEAQEFPERADFRVTQLQISRADG